MRRRDLITLIGGAAAWPLAARAQPGERVRHIGVLMALAESDPVGQMRIEAFRQSLKQLGWSAGSNLRIDYRWAGGDIGRMRNYAAELVALAPEVILANGTPVIAALKRATRSIPLVFVIVNDPVAQGFVTSVAHPGENITGFSYMDYSVVGKEIALLKEAAPGVTRVAFMFNPDTYPYYEVYLRSLLAAPAPLSLEVIPAQVRSEAEIETAITTLAATPNGGLVVPPEPFIFAHRGPIIRLTTQHRLPTVWGFRDPVAEGGLMSYAPNQTDIFRRSATYIDHILKGDKPGDLPVQAPNKFEFIINLKTARSLGLSLPAQLLAVADEVIE
jgi:putative ABC transport system substrate-binding protein